VSPGGEGRATLAVVIDGVALPEVEARAIWTKFSAYMEEHRGDLGGFAQAEGFTSVHPRSEGGRALLVFSRTEPQKGYGVPEPSPGHGSGGKKKRRR